MIKGEGATRAAVALVMLLLFVVLFLLIDSVLVICVAKALEKGEIPALLAIEQSSGCITARIKLLPALFTSVLAVFLTECRFGRRLYSVFMKRRDTMLAALVTVALFVALYIVLMLVKGSVFCGYVCPITCGGVGVRSCNLLWQICVCNP